MKRLTLWTYRIALMALNIGAVLANIYQEKHNLPTLLLIWAIIVAILWIIFRKSEKYKKVGKDLNLLIFLILLVLNLIMPLK